jgi:hypothetical protein
MTETQKLKHPKQLVLLILFAALAVVSTASAGVSGGLPPGKLCGSVSGATWKFQGQSGTQYNVSAIPAGSCGAALKSVSALTKQKPHVGVLGPHTLAGPSGFRCVGSGIITPASAGLCGSNNGARFFWAPRLKK